MKRALALLEQTKNTMPHLPRPTSRDDQDNLNTDLTSSFVNPSRRMPSANKSKPNEKLMGNAATEINSRKSTAVSSTSRIGSGSNAMNKRTSTV